MKRKENEKLLIRHYFFTQAIMASMPYEFLFENDFIEQEKNKSVAVCFGQ